VFWIKYSVGLCIPLNKLSIESKHLIWTLELRVMSVLPRYISTGNRPVDGPLLGGGRSAIVSFELEQN